MSLRSWGRFAKGVVVIGVITLLTSCYVTTQAWTQMKLLSRREPVEQVAEDLSTDPKIRAKLQFTKIVLKFAAEQGLVVDDSYSKFVKLDGPAVSYLVQAAKPDEFKLKTWWFPVVGTVPYLGFFAVEDRDGYAKQLEAEGYEVERGSAVAFSSLGWFSDPIYSSMLRDDDADLAHLYFHELTHKTAWVKGSVELNENLAEFVGEAMTERFFLAMGRTNDLSVWRQRRQDRERFKLWLAQLKAALERYFLDSKKENIEDFVAGKKALIAQHVAAKPAFVAADFVGTRPWTTPRILGASLYSPDTHLFETAFQCFGGINLGEFARHVKKHIEQADDPDIGLHSICKKNGPS